MVSDILSKKLLILLEIATGNYTKLDQIAERVNITKQAVSDYVKKMRSEGMINVNNGYYRVTPLGIDFLFEKIDEIEKYINEKKKKLQMIEVFSAIAGSNIRKGSKVALLMENGFLYAYARKKSSCHAIAIEDAQKGEDVGLTNAEGIIDMRVGKIFLAMLPPATGGGSKSVDYEKLKNAIKKANPDRVASMDVVGKIALKKIGVKPSFEFAPLEASINACERGLNVFVAGGENEIRQAIARIEDYNSAAIEKIDYEVIYK